MFTKVVLRGEVDLHLWSITLMRMRFVQRIWFVGLSVLLPPGMAYGGEPCADLYKVELRWPAQDDHSSRFEMFSRSACVWRLPGDCGKGLQVSFGPAKPGRKIGEIQLGCKPAGSGGAGLDALIEGLFDQGKLKTGQANGTICVGDSPTVEGKACPVNSIIFYPLRVRPTGPNEKVAEVLKTWGLIGTWAARCDAPPTFDNMFYTYSETPAGVIEVRAYDDVKNQDPIISAAINDEGDLQINMVSSTPESRGAPSTYTLSMSDDGRVSITDIRRPDGQKFEFTSAPPWLSRCK